MYSARSVFRRPKMDEIPTISPWKCFICATFMAVTLKALMGHYFAVHNNEPNFFVQCNIKGCPATFRRYHSFYKHVSRNHRSEYDQGMATSLPHHDDDDLVLMENPWTVTCDSSDAGDSIMTSSSDEETSSEQEFQFEPHQSRV